jgi:hypothetical protein
MTGGGWRGGVGVTGRVGLIFNNSVIFKMWAYGAYQMLWDTVIL